MAQEEFCDREYARLVGALTLYTGDADLALDLAQEAFARACQHWHRLEHMDAPGAWLHRVAMNLANAAFRHRRLDRITRVRLASLASTPDPLEPAEVHTVRAAVLGLPQRQRAALVLRYYADLSVDETARHLRCRPGTVRALTHQAVARLRKELDAFGREELLHVT